MTYRGHVENGVIVPDEPVEMEEGALVYFEIAPEPDSDEPSKMSRSYISLTQLLSRFAGKAQTLSEDAENLDHYLDGASRR